MKATIEKIIYESQATIDACPSPEDLEKVQIKVLGRKSPLNDILKSLSTLPQQERREIGPIANKAKITIASYIEARRGILEKSLFNAESEWIDVTAPGVRFQGGHPNPITIVRRHIESVFVGLGFEVADGPEVETEYNNFDALNIPNNHPARDEWDTFWLNETTVVDGSRQQLLLRTHTSPVQIRYMQTHTPPFRVIAPGKCFRNESTDSTHEHTFYQFEALVVGDDISVANFKSIGEEFFSSFFGSKITVRLRPSFFPFTEPSFEFDISCMVCGGEKCSACKRTGWLEIGGAGMVNQAVFEAVGYGRDRYTGFAWGFGIDRLAMMKYKIDDIRLFHSGDIRFIRQFSL